MLKAMVVLAVTTVAALAGCAPTGRPNEAATGEARRCFQVDRVQNFRATADQTLYLRTSRTDVFEARAVGTCRDLDRALGVSLSGPAVSTVCTGDLATIVPRGGGVASTSQCRVTIVRRLTPEQIAALPDRDRP